MNVYFLRAGNRGAIKIGVASDVTSRVATLQTGNQFKLNVMAVIPCDSMMAAKHLEGRLHRFFKRQNIRGEWFQGNIDFKKVSGNMEISDTTRSGCG